MSWSKMEIGKLVSLKQGFAINKNTKHHMSDEQTNLHLLRIGDMKDNNFSVYVKDTIPANFIAEYDDIIYTRTGQVGLVFTNQRGVVHNNCFTVTPIDETILNRNFLYYVLQTKEFYEEANSRASGAAQPDLPHAAFNSIKILLPDIEVQKRIADILSSYDNLIENNQKQIKLLEEAAQRLYKEWFVDLHFPGYENTKIVDGVPEEWRKEIIENMCETIGGGTPSTSVLSYYEGGSILWVTPTDITKNDCLVLLDTEKKITSDGLKNSSAKMLPPNTILMTSRASVGYFGVCEHAVCTNQGFISCVPYQTNMQMYLLYNLMNRVEEIRQKAGGSTYLEINKSTFRNMEITVPQNELLDIFQNYMSSIFEQMKAKKKLIDKLRKTRDYLLPKLMNGEIEV